jgi:hypothetical protein
MSGFVRRASNLNASTNAWVARVIKRYVPTGGDLVLRRLRRHHPGRRWGTSSLQSLCTYERRTRLNESIHLVGFVGFTGFALSKFASGSLTALGLAVALALNLILGLWPAILQRYNRLRLCRAIDARMGPPRLKNIVPQNT